MSAAVHTNRLLIAEWRPLITSLANKNSGLRSMMHFDANYSRRILLRLVVAGVLLAVLIILTRQFILDFYIRDQQTYAGLIANGAILTLFLAGLVKIVMGLRHYAREEAALARFIRAVDEERLDMTAGVDPSTIIHRRYNAILKVSKQHAPVNHGALASLLLADESKRLTSPRFVNNVLILMGVFGTIVGLAIALVGAADLMGVEQNLGSMDVLIHGMSVALNTTIAAIVCYLFFSYFYLKLNDAQTHLISGVEQITTLYLLPEFSRDANSIMHEVASLVSQLRETTDDMRSNQSEYAEAGMRLREAVDDFAQIGHRMSITLAELDERLSGISDDMSVIKGMLRDGFRLPAQDTR